MLTPAKLELARRLEIRASFAAFCREAGYEPAKHHLVIIRELETLVENLFRALLRGHELTEEQLRLLVMTPPGSAKALALDTPIPTPSGWTTMGQIKVGDQVIDDRGYPCNVVAVSPIWRDRPVYRVTTDCGDTIVADKDHEWVGWEGVEIVKRETHAIRKKWGKRFAIEHAKPLYLPNVELPIHPYLLGLWLGDGNSVSPRITADPNDQDFYFSELTKMGYDVSVHETRTNFSVLGVRHLFVSLNLLNDPSHNQFGRKHIPEIYLRASEEQRLALLQGLIDSDGSVDKNKGNTTFCNVDKNLAMQVRELVRSLGVKAGWSVARAICNGKDCGEAYKVSFYLLDSARLPRKKINCQGKNRTRLTYIDTELLPYTQDTVCISVDSPSHLFLCGRSMTPTHNSTYISKLFPPWFLAQCQRLETSMLRAQKRYEPLGILACTHNGALSTEFGGAARNLVSSNERWLGYALNRDSRASDAWTCTNGGYYRAGTVGSGISGRRMHLGLVDDFCGQEADATSKIENEKIWVWWQNDFVNRLQPIAARVIICNHRNEDDLAGRLLVREASKWRIVRLRLVIENEEQAADDPLGRVVGERLWPEYFTDEQVAERMANPRASGIQQQDPSPEKGAFFDRAAVEACEYETDKLPRLHESHVYGASDHAVRTNQQNDCSCLGIGLFHGGSLFIHPDLQWDRLPSNIQVAQMLRYADTYEPLFWWAEKENISGAIGPFLRAQMMEERIFMSVTEVAHKNKDLMARSQTAKAMVDAGLVRFPKNAPWWARAKKELLVFPNGKHDDFVSFLAHICRGVFKMTSPSLRPTEKKVVSVEEIIRPSMGMNITLRDVREQMRRAKRTESLLAYR